MSEPDRQSLPKNEDRPNPDSTLPKNPGEDSSKTHYTKTEGGMAEHPFPPQAELGIGEAHGRYRILRFHARGGLGEILVAEDTELRREVALKRIRTDCVGDESSQRRFLVEAEITARLEHPGVVPIYGLIENPERPSYAMRFIEGESLSEAIKRYHAPNSGLSSLERRLEQRKLIGQLIDVCNTMAYVHGRGVIHRDLKPQNIMLGKYGETLVVDWGLAKIIGRSGEAPAMLDEETLRVMTSVEEQDKTLLGHAVGTPSVMSPEQAAGRLDIMDGRSDVYSLGAMLYAVLTGHAPVQGTNAPEILQKVQQGDFERPSKANPQVSKSLEAICLKAMALKPEDRYVSATTMADDLEKWLAEEPVDAYREPFSQRAWRWVRRHRTLTTSATVLLLTALVGLAVVLGLVEESRQRISQEQRRTLEEKQRKEEALARSEQSEKDALRQSELAMATIKRVVDGLQDNIRDIPELRPLRGRLLGQALADIKKLGRGMAESETATRTTWLAHWETGDMLLHTGGRGIETEKENAPEAPDAVRQGWTKEAEWHYRKMMRIAQELAERDEGSAQAQRDLSVSHEKLGDVLLQMGDTKTALTHYQQSLDIRQKLALRDKGSAQAQRDLSVSHDKLGNVLLQMEDAKTTLTHYQQSLDIRKNLALQDEGSAQAQRDLSVSHDKLGNVLLQMKNAKAALEHYQESLKIAQKLAVWDEGSAQAQRDLSVSYNKVGKVLLQMENAKAALKHYQDSLEIAERLAGRDEGSAQAQRDLSISHDNLGDVLLQMEDTQDALKHYLASLDIARKLAERDMGSAQAKLDLVISHYKVGSIHKHERDYVAAGNQFGKALITLRQADEQTGGKLLKGSTFASWKSLFQQQLTTCEQIEKALQNIEHALEQKPPLAAQLLSERMQTLVHRKQPAEAIATAEKLVELMAKDKNHLYNAACIHSRCIPLVDESMKDQREKYAQRAVELLRQAVANGWKDVEHLDKDKDLDPLREREDFRKLLTEMEKK